MNGDNGEADGETDFKVRGGHDCWSYLRGVNGLEVSPMYRSFQWQRHWSRSRAIDIDLGLVQSDVSFDDSEHVYPMLLHFSDACEGETKGFRRGRRGL